MDELKLLISQQNPKVGDLQGNLACAQAAVAEGARQGADIVVLSELFASGYPPEDLLLNPSFIADVAAMVGQLAATTAGVGAVLVGAPWLAHGKLYNAALLLDGGKIAQVICKQHLPNYNVFDEARFFARGTETGAGIIDFRGVKLSVLICEDIWQTPPMSQPDADLTLVLNASPYEVGKRDKRIAHASVQSAANNSPLVYVNQVGGQDDLVFDGGSFVLSRQQKVILSLPAWRAQNKLTTWRKAAAGGAPAGWELEGAASASPPQPPQPTEEVYQALLLGLRDYVEKNNFSGVLLGLSGGIDSALVATLACDALGADRVHCYCLPSRFTAQESLTDARACAQALGVKLETINIEPIVASSLTALAPAFAGRAEDLTEENIQSRIRGLLLMGLSNKLGFMLLSTGNKSEMSVGYATLYGDMNGGFNPLKDIYKMKVFELCQWRNENVPAGVAPKGVEGANYPIPQNIIDKPPSAELRENQKDEDSLPPYSQLDDILIKMVDEEMPLADIVASGHDRAVVQKIASLVRVAEYKRRQSPPGVRVSARHFGKSRRYPITNGYKPESKQ